MTILDLPSWSRPLNEFNYTTGRPTTTMGTTLTSGGSANTEGTKTELIAATTQDIDTLEITMYGMALNDTATDALVSIYTGSSFGHTLIPNLLAGWTVTSLQNVGGIITYSFPIFIPRGTRIGAALRALIASDVCYIIVRGLWTGGWAGRYVEALGAATATSRGTLVTPGTSSEGTFTTIGTTGFPYKMIAAAGQGNQDSVQTTGSVYSIDVGIGSAVVAQLNEMAVNYAPIQEIQANRIFPYFVACNIPSGTTLQARLQGHTTDVEQKPIIIYGIG